MATQTQRVRQWRRAGAAFSRRLSNREVRDIVRLTTALQVTEAAAFERHGVVVHFTHNNLSSANGRAPGAQAHTGGGGAGCDTLLCDGAGCDSGGCDQGTGGFRIEN